MQASRAAWCDIFRMREWEELWVIDDSGVKEI